MYIIARSTTHSSNIDTLEALEPGQNAPTPRMRPLVSLPVLNPTLTLKIQRSST